MQVRKYFYTRAVPLREDQTLILTTSVAVVCFPHFFEIPLWCSLASVFLMAYRYLTDVGPKLIGLRVPRPKRWFLFLLCFVATYLVYLSYGTLEGLEPCTTLLVLLIGLKLNEAWHYWDAMIVLILSYFVAMTWLLFSQSLPATIYLVFAVVYSTSSLMSLHSPKSLSGYNPAGLAFRDIVKAIPVFIILFLLFPRFASPFANMMVKPSAKTGFSGDLNPGEIASLSQSNEVAFRVSFLDSEKPNYKTLYWRGTVLSDYSGLNWRKSRNKYSPGVVDVPKGAIEQDIFIEARYDKWLFGLDIPIKADFSSNEIRSKIRLTADHEILAQYSLNQAALIRVYSLPSLEFNESEEDIENNLVLSAPPSKRFMELALGFKNGARSNMQIAERALKYFRTGGFVYSREPGQIVTVDDFIFGTKKGFCEHYAGTFATLMRAAGVPARVIVGFYGGVYNDYGNYLIVRDREAHAWTEIWINGKGWQRIDPTNAVSPDRMSYEDNGLTNEIFKFAGSSGIFEKSLLFIDYINNEYTLYMINFDSAKQLELLNNLGFTFTSQWQMLLLLLILIAATAVFIGFWTGSRKIKLDRTARHYEKLLKSLTKKGIKLNSSMGPFEVLLESQKALDSANKEKLAKIIHVYVQARYASVESGPLAKDLKTLVSGF